ncbi:MAG TPA: class I SAM-dependent methyltransferase [Dehalococcoidia bacterium]|nr:class I SAM-dependent methyltransferase [Dehalococcoidia bacterium]
MSTLALPKLNLDLETMRAMYRAAYRVAGLFVNLEAVENALLNSRLIEYPFVVQKLHGVPPGPALDVGCADAGNVVAPILASLGWQVYGVDIRDFRLPQANFNFVRTDVARGTPFPDGFFDCAYAVSSIEHFGLAGRYGIREDDPQADFKAVNEVWRVLKPGSPFLLTIPYGTGGIVRPAERVYDRPRLARLLEGWQRVDQAYWRLDGRGAWRQVSEQEAGGTRTPGGVAVALLELRHA